jgi:hypothetical protein
VLLLPQLMQALKFELHVDSSLARLVLRAPRARRRSGSASSFCAQCELGGASAWRRASACCSRRTCAATGRRVGARARAGAVRRRSQIGREMRVRATPSANRADVLRVAPARAIARAARAPADRERDRSAPTVGPALDERCRVLNSKKQPLWLEFENADGGAPHVVIFKCGDDLRQDALALQVVAVLERRGAPRRSASR